MSMNNTYMYLQQLPAPFSEESNKLAFSKRVNFIFGRNGTGKTTIANEIKTQLSKTHDVHLFDGYGSVAINDKLNAIALGKENVEIDNEILKINKEIDDLNAKIGNNDKDGSLSHLLANRNDTCNKARSEIERLYTSMASRIKNMSNPQIAPTNYNKNDVRSEIKLSRQLCTEDVKKFTSVLMSSKKEHIGRISARQINYDDVIKQVNGILTVTASVVTMPPELRNNTTKQNFAAQGLQIHKTSNGHEKTCAFCGGEISDDRWDQLLLVFNNQASSTEKQIDDEIRKIDTLIAEINKIGLIDKSQFYGNYAEKLDNLVSMLTNAKNENANFLNQSKRKLQEKKQYLFTALEPIKSSTPQQLAPCIDAINRLIDENNNLSANLEKEQENAKKALRLHHIDNMAAEANYSSLEADLNIASRELAVAQSDLNEANSKLNSLKEKKANLLSQTKDVRILANKINNALRSTGGSSFSLVYADGDPGSGGYYRVKGANEGVRDITHLSTGELNIVSFLYFVFKTHDQISSTNKPYVVIFDDPMNSNDSTMQYLMISKLQELYESINQSNNGLFILLTHNCNFFLNVRKPAKGLYSKYGFFNLMTDGTTTMISAITNGSNDFSTSYELLWKELVYLFDTNKPDLMLNCCRRICETYIKFNCISASKFYTSDLGAKKLFDVNQHSIDDLESDLNGKTSEEIKNILFSLFEHNNASEHFNSHWSKFRNDKQHEHIPSSGNDLPT